MGSEDHPPAYHLTLISDGSCRLCHGYLADSLSHSLPVNLMTARCCYDSIQFSLSADMVYTPQLSITLRASIFHAKELYKLYAQKYGNVTAYFMDLLQPVTVFISKSSVHLFDIYHLYSAVI